MTPNEAGIVTRGVYRFALTHTSSELGKLATVLPESQADTAERR